MVSKKKSKPFDMKDPETLMIVIAVLVNQRGGQVSISQQDIDEIAYSTLLEGHDLEGNKILRLHDTRPAGQPS